MVDNDDIELMAALFVNDDGEIKCEPGWLEQTGEEEWRDWPEGWSPATVPAPVAAGILRLLRERDRLREALKRYGAHGPRCLLGGACSCGLSDLVA
jgi:hypothetical protein